MYLCRCISRSDRSPVPRWDRDGERSEGQVDQSEELEKENADLDAIWGIATAFWCQRFSVTGSVEGKVGASNMPGKKGTFPGNLPRHALCCYQSLPATFAVCIRQKQLRSSIPILHIPSSDLMPERHNGRLGRHNAPGKFFRAYCLRAPGRIGLRSSGGP